MEISHRIENSIGVVSIEGNLTIDSAIKAKNCLITLIEDSELKGIVLNGKGINTIDSNGVGVIVNAFKMCKLNQKGFSLCCLSQQNTEVFNLLALDRLITLYTTEQEAIDSCFNS